MNEAGFQENIDELKQRAFLRRIAQVSEGDPSRWIPVGALGTELGLSYGETLSITDRLREQGFIRRGGGGPLDPPHGPRVHILTEGLEYLDSQNGE